MNYSAEHDLRQHQQYHTSRLVLIIPAEHDQELKPLEDQSPHVLADLLNIAKRILDTSRTTLPADHDAVIEREKQLLTQYDNKLATITANHQAETRQIQVKLAECEQLIQCRDAQINMMRGESIKIREEEMLRAQRTADQQQTLNKQQLDDLRHFAKQEVELSTQRHQAELSQLREDLEKAKQEVDQAHQQVQQARQEAKDHVREMAANYATKLEQSTSRIEPMLQKASETIESFRAGVRAGTAGEQLVCQVFDSLELGYLDDTRHATGPGHEDFRWRCPPSPGQGRDWQHELICNVEVKDSQKLHSQHDIQKHITRTQEASVTAATNAGLFISLRCRIPNMRPIQLKSISGIPVLYVSGGGSLPAQAAIETGFRLMAILWPLLHAASQADGTDHTTANEQQRFDTICNAVTEHLEQHINRLHNIDKDINELEKNAQAQLRIASRLRKNRDTMLADITSIQQTVPEIAPQLRCCPQQPTAETIDADTETELIHRVIQFYNDNRHRYPKTWDDIDLSGLPPPCHNTTIADINAKAKRKRKRENTNSDTSASGNTTTP
jgi:hypothetical protein